MILFDLKQTWEDYKYYVVVAAILVVLLIVILISCIVSASKKKNKLVKQQALNSVKEAEEAHAEETTNEPAVEVQEEVEAEEEPAAEVQEEVEAEEEPAVEVKEEVETEEEPALEKDNSETVVTLAEVSPVEEPQTEESVEEPIAEEPVEEPVAEEPKKEAKVAAKKPAAKKATAEKTTTKAKTTAKGKYEIVPDAEGFKYILKASNGESLIVSENYTTVLGAKNAIKRLKENSKDAEIKIEQDKKKNFQFHVVRGTRIVAHSANYSTKVSATNASNSFLKFVDSEKIEVIETVEDTTNQPELVDLTNSEISTETVGKIVVSMENDAYLYRLYANNGQVICMSPTYKTLATIKSSIAKFQEAVYQGKFYIICDKNNNYQFKLYSQTNRLIMTGESFTSKDNCRSNIESCYRFAKNAVVEEYAPEKAE